MPITVQHEVAPQLLAELALRANAAEQRARQQAQDAQMAAAGASIRRAQIEAEARARAEQIQQTAETERQKWLWTEGMPAHEKAAWELAHPAEGTPEFDRLKAFQAMEHPQKTPEELDLAAYVEQAGKRRADYEAGQKEFEANRKRADDALAKGEIDQAAHEQVVRELYLKKPEYVPPVDPQKQFESETFVSDGRRVFRQPDGRIESYPVVDPKAEAKKQEAAAAQKEEQTIGKHAAEIYKTKMQVYNKAVEKWGGPYSNQPEPTPPDFFECVREAREAWDRAKPGHAPADVIESLLDEIAGQAPSVEAEGAAPGIGASVLPPVESIGSAPVPETGPPAPVPMAPILIPPTVPPETVAQLATLPSLNRDQGVLVGLTNIKENTVANRAERHKQLKTLSWLQQRAREGDVILQRQLGKLGYTW